MTHANYETTVGDAGPLIALLRRNGSPIDLTAATSIRLRLTPVSGGSPFDVELLGSVLNAGGGHIQHTWTAWPAAGDYRAQYRLTYPGGVAFVPNVPDGAAGSAYRFRFHPAL